MPDIVLTTLNARYIHAAFGLRYLFANLGQLQKQAGIAEFDINQRPTDIAEQLLARSPKIVGLGVYIWNAAVATDVVSILKRIRPDIVIVLGGPEVSYEWEDQRIVQMADHLITGEADLEFRRLCEQILSGTRSGQKVISPSTPTFEKLALPYNFYTDEDIANRILYVEASRGCPFQCEFCLSSLDVPVRQAELDEFLAAMGRLIDRGARHLKFVDRTFNLNLKVSLAILEFCLNRHEPGMLFHFEMIPDRLPDELRQLIQQFPAGAIQLEVGIQTFNEEAATRISRRQNNDKASTNLAYLRSETGVHIHADLIAGLPGESLESFGAGFNRLAALHPQEIQVGILKKLRGTPIARHDNEWSMIYSDAPPYEILQNSLLDYPTIQRLKRFARFWDLIANSGNFVETTRLLLTCGRSAFETFLTLSDWIFARANRTDSISLTRLLDFLWRYLVDELKLDPKVSSQVLLKDYQRTGRSDVPKVLQPHAPNREAKKKRIRPRGLKRQDRHLKTPNG